MKKVLVVTLLALALSAGLASADSSWEPAESPEKFREAFRDCLFIVYGVEVADYNDAEKLAWVLHLYGKSKGFKSSQWALAIEMLWTECALKIETAKNKEQELPIHSK